MIWRKDEDSRDRALRNVRNSDRGKTLRQSRCPSTQTKERCVLPVVKRLLFVTMV